jgi:hypothetical protein
MKATHANDAPILDELLYLCLIVEVGDGGDVVHVFWYCWDEERLGYGRREEREYLRNLKERDVSRFIESEADMV